MRFTKPLALVTIGLLASPAAADLITYTHTGIGSGMLGGSAFENAGFVITAVADTNDAVALLPFATYIPHLSSSIAIDGMGTFEFTMQTMTFAEHLGQWGAPTVGFGVVDGGGGPVGVFWGPLNSVFGSWDTTTELDTVAGDSFHLGWQFQTMETTGGLLIFDDSFMSLTPGTFTAVIPSPGALALLAVGGLTGFRRRRK